MLYFTKLSWCLCDIGERSWVILKFFLKKIQSAKVGVLVLVVEYLFCDE